MSCPDCGPAVSVFRSHRPGDQVYCRLCTREFVIGLRDAVLTIAPTGANGDPVVAVSVPDVELISRLILDAVEHLPEA